MFMISIAINSVIYFRPLEICPDDLFCLNGGTCVPDDELNSICM